MAGASRKGMGRRIRFDVFKRDSFTCQYCGRTPPTVILHIDHVVAVANGGGEELDNLLTSCRECNLGKGARPLGDRPAPRPNAEELLKRREEEQLIQDQMFLYNEFLMERREEKQDAIERLGRYWYNKTERVKDQYVFGTGRAPSIGRFLDSLPEARIAEAMDIAHANRPPSIGSMGGRTFRYFCAVCWNWIREQEGLPTKYSGR